MYLSDKLCFLGRRHEFQNFLDNNFFLIISVFFYVNYKGAGGNTYINKNLPALNEPSFSKDDSELGSKNNRGEIFCHNLLLPVENFYNWKKDKQREIQTFFLGLVEQSIHSEVIDYVALKSELGILLARNLINQDKQDVRIPLFEESKPMFASPQFERKLTQSIAIGNVALLKRLLSQKGLPKNAFYLGKDSLTSLISLLIESKNNFTEGFEEVLEFTLSANITVTYTDLITATKNHLPLFLIDDLYNASSLNASKILTKRNVFTSLSLEALIFKNYQAAIYWYDKGSKYKPDEFSLNGIDILFYHGFDKNNEHHTEILKALLKEKIVPLSSLTMGKIQENLPEKHFLMLQKQFNNRSFGLSEEQLILADDFISQMFNLLLNDRLKSDVAESIKNNCQNILGRKLMRIVTQFDDVYNDRKKQKTLKPKNYKEKLTADEMNELIDIAESLYYEKSAIETYLLNNNNLNSKRVVKQYRIKAINDLSKALQEEARINLDELDGEMEEQLQITAQQLIALVKQGKYDEALTLLNSNEHIDLALLMQVSIDFNADVSFIISLIELGVELPENTIFSLIKNNELSKIEILSRYGLSFNYIDPMGRTTIENSVVFKRLNILKFILDNNYSRVTTSLGFDALNLAIKDFDMAQEGVAYISRLLAAGAKVDNSHLHLMYEMKVKNKDWYEYIASIHPELSYIK